MDSPSTKGAEEARAQLPGLLDAAERGEATIITRRGRPVAALTPIDGAMGARRQSQLLDLRGSGRGLWGEDAAAAIAAGRAEWDR